MTSQGYRLNHRLSEPTFRNPNFAARSAAQISPSADHAACSISGDNRSTSLDYRKTSTSNSTTPVKNGTCAGVRRIKCVFVGDAKVGKTSLIVSYTTNGYPKDYSPTAFDNFSVLVRVNDQPVQIQICDTAGQNGFDNLRPLCYPNADVFVLCFSVVTPDSFYALHSKWLPEVTRHAAPSGASTTRAPLILVGTQSDRRTNVSTLLELSQLGETVVAEHEAEEYRTEIGAVRYVECSALTQRNLKEVFDTCILTALKAPLADHSKSKIEKARNMNSHDFTSNVRNCASRKSFKKLREKLKRSNSVDSGKYTSVQVRRQLSSGRINQVGLMMNASLDPKTENVNRSFAAAAASRRQNDFCHSSSTTKKLNLVSSSASTSRINCLFGAIKAGAAAKDAGESLPNRTSTNKKVCKSFSEHALRAMPLQQKSRHETPSNFERQHRKDLNKLRHGWRKLLCMA